MLILIVIEIGPKIDSWVGWPRELRLELPVPLPDDPERRRPNKARRSHTHRHITTRLPGKWRVGQTRTGLGRLEARGSDKRSFGARAERNS